MTHTTCTQCGASFTILPPERIVAYLVSKGWRRMGVVVDKGVTEWTSWRFGFAHPDVSVPMRADLYDYPRNFYALLIDLHRIESRPIADIVEEMGK